MQYTKTDNLGQGPSNPALECHCHATEQANQGLQDYVKMMGK